MLLLTFMLSDSPLFTVYSVCTTRCLLLYHSTVAAVLRLNRSTCSQHALPDAPGSSSHSSSSSSSLAFSLACLSHLRSHSRIVLLNLHRYLQSSLVPCRSSSSHLSLAYACLQSLLNPSCLLCLLPVSRYDVFYDVAVLHGSIYSI